MFRSYKTPTPQKISRKKDAPVAPQVSQQHPTLQLQALIGNHATNQMIQRMPTATTIETVLGKPKKHVGLIKNSTKYRLILDRVNAYHNYATKTAIGSTAVAAQAQIKHLMGLMTAVMQGLNAYTGKTGTKGSYFNNMKRDVQRDMDAASRLLINIVRNPGHGSGTQLSVMLTMSTSATPQLQDANITGNDKGGTSEVTEYSGANSGFFKANKNTLYDPSQGLSPNLNAGMRQGMLNERIGNMSTAMTTQHGIELGSEKSNALQNEFWIGVDMVGISSQNARMAQRDVAMARLDKLLGGGIIAKAELAVQHSGGQTTEGSLMEKAKGVKASKAASDGGFYDHANGEAKDGAKPKQINLQDPNLMRLLSRMQLIDVLAYQVDRNRSNYYIQTDANGNVTGITGIDNDFAMGTKDNVDVRHQQLPGMSRFVDEDLANTILNLDPETLKLVMSDLLDDNEITALLSRLQKLKAFLRPLRDGGQLLKPNQWTTAIAQNLLDEKHIVKGAPTGSSKNYYSALVGDKR